MRNRNRFFSACLVACLVVWAGLALASAKKSKDRGMVTIKGYVIDSACAIRKDLDKPISKDCAIACAKAGSPLVIMDDNGVIYLPISDLTPATSQNERLMPFAGDRVTVTGTWYEKGGACGIVIDKIEPLGSAK